MSLKFNTLIYNLSLLLILLLPWHSLLIFYFFAKFIPNLNFWKYIVVCLLVILTVLQKQSLKLASYDIPLLIVTVCFLLLMAVHLTYSPYPDALKSYLYATIPLFAFIAGIRSGLSTSQVQRLSKITGINACMMLVWAFVQAWILGPDFLINLGYPAAIAEWKQGQLLYTFYFSSSDIQRLNGGFAGPLPYAFFMLFLLYIFTSNFYRSRLFSIIALVAIVFTFSRTFIFAALAYMITNLRFSSIKILMITLLLGLPVYVVLSYAGSNFVSDVANYARETANLTDHSLKNHIASYASSLPLLNQYLITGIGLGSIGSHVAANEVVSVESTLLSITLELGAITAFSIITLYTLVVIRLSDYKSRSFLVILALVSFAVPLQYYNEVTIFIGYFLGMVANLNVEKPKN